MPKKANKDERFSTRGISSLDQTPSMKNGPVAAELSCSSPMPIPDPAQIHLQSPGNYPVIAPRRRRLRIVLWTVASLLALVLVGAVVLAIWLRSAEKAALPVLDGDLHLAGLSAPVTVLRDAHGVPHIQATTQDDLFVAQGYVTAQDRLWQMDMFRRYAKGELAEILGPTLVWHDKTQRVLQIANIARRIYSNLAPADRARFDDYARGVNQFIAQHQDSLPAEFKLLAYRPQPWTGADSVVIGLMMVEDLDTHFYTKLTREQISHDLHDPKLESDLYPVGSWRDHPPTGEVIDWSQPHPAPAGTNDDDDNTQALVGSSQGALKTGQLNSGQVNSGEDLQFLRSLLGQPTCDGCTLGSNNWVVAGSHTASGKPMLSNDMHLGLTEPNIWFMADLLAPGFHAAGVTLPGMPFVIAGHNDHVGWGFTALYADVQDVYIERLDGKGNFQDADGNWKPLNVDHETIKVRGAKDVQLDVQSTAHGPLLNPILTKETRPLSLKWTLYDPALNTIPVYQINVASNWTEFLAALDLWSWPTQNVVYADDQGNIGYHAIGRVPIRNSGTRAFALPLPSLVNDSRFEWEIFRITKAQAQRPICRPTFPSTKCPAPSIRHPDFLPLQTRA